MSDNSQDQLLQCRQPLWGLEDTAAILIPSQCCLRLRSPQERSSWLMLTILLAVALTAVWAGHCDAGS